MKKTLLLTLLLSIHGISFSSDEHKVTPYGMIDLTIENHRISSLGNRGFIGSNDSYIGIKSIEPLGSGFKLTALAEGRINPDGKSNNQLLNTLNSDGLRDAYINFGSPDYGYLQIGHFLTPYSQLSKSFDPFYGHTSSILSAFGSLGFNAISGASYNSYKNNVLDSSFNNRVGNQIQYNAPNKISGLQLTGSLALNENPTTNSANPHTSSFSAIYQKNNLKFAYGYQRQKDLFGLVNSVGGQTVLPDEHSTDQAHKLILNYTSDEDLSVGMIFEHLSYKRNGQLNPNAINGAQKNTIGLTYSQPIAIGVLNAAYIKSFDINCSTSQGTCDTSNTGFQQFSIGYDLVVSKRTTIYSHYSTQINDSNASYVPAFNSISTNSGTRNNTFLLGFKHKF